MILLIFSGPFWESVTTYPLIFMLLEYGNSATFMDLLKDSNWLMRFLNSKKELL